MELKFFTGLYEAAAFFYIYGVLGWCVEVAYAAVKQGKFINRGFLNGPICPIYGVGVVLVIYCLGEVRGNLLVLYAASIALVTVIEGITGFVMDKMFHHKWWDYSNQPLNIGGYVCLVFSLIWGIGWFTADGRYDSWSYYGCRTDAPGCLYGAQAQSAHQ